MSHSVASITVITHIQEPAWSCLAKQVLKPLGSYMQVFTVSVTLWRLNRYWKQGLLCYLCSVWWVTVLRKLSWSCAWLKARYHHIFSAPFQDLLKGCIIHVIMINYNTLSSHLFHDWLKAYSEFSKSAPVTSCSCRSYNNHYKEVNVTGNHVLYECSAWILMVIMSSLLVAWNQWRSKNLTFKFFHSMYNKTIIRLCFCDIQNNQDLS